jgi:hypothetical protein
VLEAHFRQVIEIEKWNEHRSEKIQMNIEKARKTYTFMEDPLVDLFR